MRVQGVPNNMSYSRNSKGWEEMRGVVRPKRKKNNNYIPTDPKLKASRRSWVGIKRPRKPKDSLQQEIEQYYKNKKK